MVPKTLVGLLTGLSLFGVECYQNPEYHFKGKIGEEQIEFEDDWINGANTLQVIKKDGTKVVYRDWNHDFAFKSMSDYVEITRGENTTMYEGTSENPVVKKFLEQAEKDFNDYLKKIIEVQTSFSPKE